MKRKNIRTLSFALAVIMIFASLATVALAADLGTLAGEFCAAVDAFADTTGIVPTLDAITLAEAKLDAYTAAGGTVDDTAVAESYAKFVSLKTATNELVAACDSFAGYVNEAVYYHSQEMYPETRANLDLAAEYIDKIKTSDPYVSGPYSDYIRIKGELHPDELLCEAFVEYAANAASATTYAEADRYLKEAKNAEKGITLVGFINEEEAYANIAKAEAFMRERKTEALVFISRVHTIKHDDLESFRVALAALEGVDTTTEGVDIAEEKLDRYIQAYNKKVKAANDAHKEACSFIDSLA